MASRDIIEFIKQGSKARLIPVVADSKKEERATSVLLSSFMIIPSYAESVLADAGAKIGKRSEIKCYTEIIFSDKEIEMFRPDGLIVITSGSKSWSALVEAKIGNNDLSKEQIENYLDVAKAVGADALITISNQFATIPTHHPVSVSKTKIKTVDLYHFSWMSLLSKAIVMSNSQSLADREQAIVLKELVRYLSHTSSGVSPINSMGVKWKTVCDSVQQGAAISKSSDDAVEVVQSWQQLFRYLAIELSMATGSKVDVVLSRAHIKEPEVRLKSDIQLLITKNTLMGELSVPNAAGNIIVLADVARRTVTISTRLDAPADRSRPVAAINWLTRQLKDRQPLTGTLVRAGWPGRVPDTQNSYESVLSDSSVIVPEGMKEIPKYLEILTVCDLGAKFKGTKVFVESMIDLVPKFYKDIGENLSKWVPPAPKIKSAPDINAEDGIDQDVNDGEGSIVEMDVLNTPEDEKVIPD